MYARLILFFFYVVVRLRADQALNDRARGSEIVNTVVDRIRNACIFLRGNLFLRRLAYVESADGTDPKTFRPGYYGGIWQIDETKFLATTNCSARLLPKCLDILSEFSIDWKRVPWRALLKPLYSALAASLYTLLTVGPDGVPPDPPGQQVFWRDVFHDGTLPYSYVDRVHVMPDVCSSSQLDVVFVVDSSSSVDSIDFYRTLDFVKEAVTTLFRSSPDTRIAVVKYSSFAMVEFHLDRYHTAAQISSYLDNMVYVPGGSNIAEAINVTIHDVFSAGNGARREASKIAILITDGRSKSSNATIAVGQDVHRAGIRVFTIGVGRVNIRVLNALASAPTCNHVYLLPTFAHISDIVYDVLQGSCAAPAIRVLRCNTTTEIVRSSLPDQGLKKHFHLTSDDMVDCSNTNNYLQVAVDCGVVHMYGSYSSPRPSLASNDFTYTVTKPHPTKLLLQHNRPFYLTVEALKIDTGVTKIASCPSANISIAVKNEDHSGFNDSLPTSIPNVSVTSDAQGCQGNADGCPQVQKQQLCTPDLDKIKPPANPCPRENIHGHVLSFVHPFDKTKFILCDLSGKMYIAQCPPGEAYDVISHGCGSATSAMTLPSRHLLSRNTSNPCTARDIRDGQFHFTHPDPDKFIQCDVWGNPWVQLCPSSLVWDQIQQTCVRQVLLSSKTTTATSVDVKSPALTQASPTMDPNICQHPDGAGFYAHPDPTKYIQCLLGQKLVLRCPPGQLWSEYLTSCVMS
ncbi:uncharacterized protein [Haliotis cracherodii]|uniref:uncharacterized protein n=1 Tax=Haliotis cracherodii TaxID=6455 RepID=UPI0039E7E915